MNILNFILSSLLLYKYVALALVVYTAAIILPLPSNAMLLAVGAFASNGYFNIWIALAVAVIANTAGDVTDYWLTRIFGDKVTRLLRLHKFKFYEQLKEEFRRDAAVTVFTTRFAGSLSPIASLLAGLVVVPFGTFLWWDFLGNLIEPGVALALGYAVGDYWNEFSGPMEVATSIIAVLIIIFVLFRIQRRIARRHGES